jgi:hypothetical protein
MGMKGTFQETLYRIPQRVLDQARAFFVERGLEGCEGTALWIGQPSSSGGSGGAAAVDIVRLFVPEQICTKTAFGISVDLTPEAHYTLTDNLVPGERFYVRIHSHPREAYHSEKDDANPVLTHQGAISIVVPYFAADPIDLQRCAIYRLEHGMGWVRMEPDEVAQVFEVVP